MLDNNHKGSSKTKVLVGSPVFQKPEILEAFLNSLKALDYDGTIDYMFVDDNADEKSKNLLAEFQRKGSSTFIIQGTENTAYVCDDESHHWDDNLMFKVANYKNTIIRHAIDNGYDELFFVDSDLILHPDLILHLKSRQKEVVSEIFWSIWHEGLPLEPNVWLFDEYDLVPKDLGEKLTIEEEAVRREEFIEKLKRPGIYEVGGLGACTLINRTALLKGVNFSPIKNLTIHGEDRFFCIRAAVLGIEMFVDTSFPAYHIYREKDLAGVEEYIKKCQEKIAKKKITLSMVVKNEENRYLESMLKSLVGHIDEAVIIDDASTDATVEICKKVLGDIPLEIIENTKSMFSNEVELRKKQWEETVKTNPDWILNLDADEMLEESVWETVGEILDNPDCTSCDFVLYDMWNETHYREDEFWSAHKTKRTFLLRYQNDFPYVWHETPQHCGRFPANCNKPEDQERDYRIQHWGWSSQESRETKYKRYKQLDPNAVFGIKEQYESILDKEPRLIPWQKS